MILSYTVNPGPDGLGPAPVWFHQLHAGDYFSFTKDAKVVWLKGDHGIALCLQTGVQSDYIFASRQKCWLVSVGLVVTPMHASARHWEERTGVV